MIIGDTRVIGFEYQPNHDFLSKWASGGPFGGLVFWLKSQPIGSLQNQVFMSHVCATLRGLHQHREQFEDQSLFELDTDQFHSIISSERRHALAPIDFFDQYFILAVYWNSNFRFVWKGIDLDCVNSAVVSSNELGEFLDVTKRFCEANTIG